MAQILVQMIGTGKPGDAYRVALPNYSMIGEPDYKNMTAVVEVPDDELTADKTRPDSQKIRQKYRGQPAWDRADVAADV